MTDRDPAETRRGSVQVPKKHPKPKPKPKPKPPAPKPAPPPPAPPSWRLPGPVILDGSPDQGQHIDPATGKPYKGIGSVGVIWIPGVCPLWRVTPVNGSGVGWCAQIEGADQIQQAAAFLKTYPKPGDSVCVVTTGNLRTAPPAMLAVGCNTAFMEVNAQALPDASGESDAQLQQIRNDGYLHTSLSFGVYDQIGLQHYLDECTAKGIMGQLAEVGWMVFSGAGMGDTNSWPDL